MIDLYDFLSSKKNIHDENVTNYKDGLLFFIENREDADAITYNSVRHFSINNIAILELDNEGNYFYEFSVDRHGDIIDNIFLEHLPNVNAVLSYYIGSKNYSPNEVKKFVVCASIYYDFKIRVTFLEKPNLNDEFKIIMRNYLLETGDRKRLATNPLKCDNIRYYNGTCCG